MAAAFFKVGSAQDDFLAMSGQYHTVSQVRNTTPPGAETRGEISEIKCVNTPLDTGITGYTAFYTSHVLALHITRYR